VERGRRACDPRASKYRPSKHDKPCASWDSSSAHHRVGYHVLYTCPGSPLAHYQTLRTGCETWCCVQVGPWPGNDEEFAVFACAVQRLEKHVLIPSFRNRSAAHETLSTPSVPGGHRNYSLLDQRFARQRVSHSAVRGPLNELTLMSCRLASSKSFFLRSIFAAIRNVRTPFGLDFSRRVVSKRAPSALTTPAGRRGAATTKQHSDGRATRSSNGPFTLDALKASAKQCGRLWRRVSNKLAMSSSAKCSLCKHGPKPRPQ
jgi:hypothetical protein